jgi:hypothetical protein
MRARVGERDGRVLDPAGRIGRPRRTDSKVVPLIVHAVHAGVDRRPDQGHTVSDGGRSEDDLRNIAHPQDEYEIVKADDRRDLRARESDVMARRTKPKPAAGSPKPPKAGLANPMRQSRPTLQRKDS